VTVAREAHSAISLPIARDITHHHQGARQSRRNSKSSVPVTRAEQSLLTRTWMARGEGDWYEFNNDSHARRQRRPGTRGDFPDESHQTERRGVRPVVTECSGAATV